MTMNALILMVLLGSTFFVGAAIAADTGRVMIEGV